MFTATSRYANSQVKKLTTDEGETIVYIERRILPPLLFDSSLSNVQEMIVSVGDRLDNISFRFLGDPELYWRICDVNDSLFPLDLTNEPGRAIRIPIPGLTVSTGK
jgi:nucleoid-associated protein YgaU